jgi:hypothetical protein
MLLVSNCSMFMFFVGMLHSIRYFVHATFIHELCILDMIVDECLQMPNCNLAKMVHNKRLQQSRNIMNSLYKATMDDLMKVLMQIANYRSWLIGVPMAKPKFNVLEIESCCPSPARSGAPKLLAQAMRSYPWAKELKLEIVHWRN